METKLRFISFIIKRKRRISPLDCRLPSAGWVLVLLRHLRNSNELLDLSAANKIFHSVFLFKCLKRKKQNKTAHAHFTSMFWRTNCTWASLEVILASCYSELPPALTFYKTIFIFPTTQKQKNISVMFDLCHVTNKVTQEFCHSSLTINITKCQTLKGKFLNKMHYSAADDILHVWKLSRHTAFLQHLRW